MSLSHRDLNLKLSLSCFVLTIFALACNGDPYFDQPVKYGQATYYSGGLGSCGFVSSGYHVAAITVKYMGNPPNGNPNKAPLCAPQYCILGNLVYFQF